MIMLKTLPTHMYIVSRGNISEIFTLAIKSYVISKLILSGKHVERS